MTKTTKKKIQNCTFIIVLIIGTYIFITKEVLDSKILKNLEAKSVSRIVVCPSLPGWEVNLTDSVVYIDDRMVIDSIITLLHSGKPYTPNHPTRIWEIKLIVVTNGDSIYTKIANTSDNGTIIYTSDGKFKEDLLGKYLEGFAKKANLKRNY